MTQNPAHSFGNLPCRLRKAVRHAMAASCGEERAQRAALDTQLQRKLGATRALQAGLARQLTAVRQEQAEARAQRAALTAALDAQRWVPFAGGDVRLLASERRRGHGRGAAARWDLVLGFPIGSMERQP